MTEARDLEDSGDGPMNGRWLSRGLASGDPEVLTWLAGRVRERALPRFAGWAWRWIEQDFISELTLSLAVTVTRPEFRVHGSTAAYVDRAIANLCNGYFRHLAGMRNNPSLDDGDLQHEPPAPTGLRQIWAGLETRQILQRLDRRCRQLLVGKYVTGLSARELADDLGIAAQTVESRLHTCRQRAREVWMRRRPRNRPSSSTVPDSSSRRPE